MQNPGSDAGVFVLEQQIHSFVNLCCASYYLR